MQHDPNVVVVVALIKCIDDKNVYGLAAIAVYL
jgi:hypothetical protein